MRPAVLILSITTATFAATTVYFARELAAARSQTPVPAGLATTAAPPPPPTPTAAPGTQTTVARVDTAKPAPAGNANADANANVSFGTQLNEADIKRMQADHSRRFLARLEDPQGRDEMRAEHRMMFRQMYPGLDKFLGLDSGELAQLMNLMADQQIGMQEKHARCMLDPDCGVQNLAYSGDNQAREINDFLGAERAGKFDTYKNTMGEREAVTQFRNRLADNSRFGQDASERLITALAEERAAMHREAAVSGSGMHSFGMGSGILYAPAEGSFETRYEAAKQNSQRLRDRAAQHLNAEQMRTFNEMQDELLLSMRNMLRNKGGSINAVSIAMPVGTVTGEALVIAERAEKSD